MKQIELREGARRQHRSVALLGMIQAWRGNLDAICFQRDHIERLVGIERFRGTRVVWLKEDLKEYFPYLESLVYSGKDSFASIFASRVPLVGKFPKGKMSDQQRADGLKANGIQCEIFQLWSRPRFWNTSPLKGSFDGLIPLVDGTSNFNEKLMTTYLNLLASGAISPEDVIRACNGNQAASS